MRKTEQAEQTPTVQTGTAAEGEIQEIPVARRELRVSSVESVEGRVAVQTVVPLHPRRTKTNRLVQRAGQSLLTAVAGGEGPNGVYAAFCDDLAALLAAGIPAAEALIAASRSASPELQRICTAAAEQAAQGEPLSHAFAPWQERLPDSFVPVLAAEEASGTQEQAVRRLAALFRQGIASGHKFEYSVLGVRSALNAGSSEWAPGRATTRQKRNEARDQRNLRLPYIGMVCRSMAMARWARSFSTLWNSGVPISSALELSARSAQNTEVARALCHAAARTRQGCTLSQSLAETQLLSGHALAVLETSDLTGDYTSLLDQFAELVEDDAKERAAKAVALFFFGPPFLIALLTAIGALIFAWMRRG